MKRASFAPLLTCAMGALAVAVLPACTQPNAQHAPGKGSQYIHPIQSIDPDDNGFEDLQAIAEDIGDARIVLLGEQTHGGGNAFLAKTRVVKYLHERLGFDVLAFEGGMYEMERARELIAAGGKPSGVLPQAIYRVWAQSQQVQPLMHYLDGDARGENPLQLTGFDMQFSGSGPLTQELPNALTKLNTELPGEPAGLARIQALVAGLQANGYREMVNFAGLKTLDLAALHSDVQATLARIERWSNPRASFWRQYLQSIEQLLAFFKQINAKEGGGVAFNMRDEQMAANFAWLANEAYAGKKIIVWAATAHIIKDRDVIETDKASPRLIPTGTYVHEQFGSNAYVIAFTAGEGAIVDLKSRNAVDKGAAPPDSIEAEIARSGHEYAYVGRKGLQKLFGTKRVSWLLGFAPMKSTWGDVVDGLFFFRTEQPSKYLDTQPAQEP